MFCEKCGNKVSDNDRFCENCGNNLLTDVNNGIILDNKKTEEICKRKILDKVSKNKKPIIITAVAIALLCVVISSVLFVNRTTPEKALANVIDAINNRDADAMLDTYPEEQLKYYNLMFEQAKYELQENGHDYDNFQEYYEDAFLELIKHKGSALDDNYDFYIDYDILLTEDVTEESAPDMDDWSGTYQEFLQSMYSNYLNESININSVTQFKVRWKITADDEDITDIYVNKENDEDSAIQDVYVAETDSGYFIYTALIYDFLGGPEYILNEYD